MLLVGSDRPILPTLMAVWKDDGTHTRNAWSGQLTSNEAHAGWLVDASAGGSVCQLVGN
jgi:hypothetical protein